MGTRQQCFLKLPRSFQRAAMVENCFRLGILLWRKQPRGAVELVKEVGDCYKVDKTYDRVITGSMLALRAFSDLGRC